MKVLGTVIAASVVALGSVSPSAAATPAKPAMQGKRSTIKAARISVVNGTRVARKRPMIDFVQLNQPPNGVNGFFADDACGLCGGPQSIADNFIINDPSGGFVLQQIDMFGGYFPT